MLTFQGFWGELKSAQVEKNLVNHWFNDNCFCRSYWYAVVCIMWPLLSVFAGLIGLLWVCIMWPLLLSEDENVSTKSANSSSKIEPVRSVPWCLLFRKKPFWWDNKIFTVQWQCLLQTNLRRVVWYCLLCDSPTTDNCVINNYFVCAFNCSYTCNCLFGRIMVEYITSLVVFEYICY